MRGESCRIRECMIRGYRAVVLEHERLAVTVLPGKGAEIYSIVYRPLEFDVLWKAPWGLHRPNPVSAAYGDSEAAWMDCYGGGWQGIFPNGGDACVYAGAPLSFHGEASTAEWDYTCASKESSAWISLQTSLPRSPFHLTREIFIECGSQTIKVKETVENRAEELVHAMWGHHPALATDFLRGARIETSAKSYEPHAPAISETSRVLSDTLHSWPLVMGNDGIRIDLSQLPSGQERISELGYLSGFDQGQYRVRNSSLGLGLEFNWDHKLFPYLWHWLEWGGSSGYPWYGRCRVGALEPFSSIPGSGLINAMERGTALLFAPSERHTTEVSMSLFPI